MYFRIDLKKRSSKNRISSSQISTMTSIEGTLDNKKDIKKSINKSRSLVRTGTTQGASSMSVSEVKTMCSLNRAKPRRLTHNARVVFQE